MPLLKVDKLTITFLVDNSIEWYITAAFRYLFVLTLITGTVVDIGCYMQVYQASAGVHT